MLESWLPADWPIQRLSVFISGIEDYQELVITVEMGFGSTWDDYI